MKRSLVYGLLLVFAISMSACGAKDSYTSESTLSNEPQKAQAVLIQNDYETMFLGETNTLKCVAVPSDSRINEADVVWSSSNPGIVSVDNSGLVTGNAIGEATVTAVLGKEQLQAETHISIVAHVSSIQVEETDIELLLGTKKDTYQFVPKIIPENAYIQDISISSSDESVVSVDDHGIARAIAPGIAEIRFQSMDSKCTGIATCSVTVRQGVQTISLNDDEIDIYLGEEHFLEAKVFPDDANNTSVVWSSQDESVATVDQNGHIATVGEGTTVISCSAADGGEAKAECVVHSVIGVESITISNEESVLLLGNSKGGSCQLTCEVFPKDATYSQVNWSSSDEALATVNEKGFVEAVSPGKVTITATSIDPRAENSIFATHDFIIETAVQKIEITGLDYNVNKGTNKRLSATVLPENANNKKVSWSSSNDKIMTVDSYGNINAVGVGRVTIICEALDGSGVVKREQYNVFQSVNSITVSEGYNTATFCGQQKQLHAEINPSDASNKKVSWESSDTKVATVDQQGVVTGKTEGIAYITATADDGSGKSCTVTVYVEPANPVSIEGVGFGIYLGDMIAFDIKNHCSRLAISNIHFTIDLTTFDGSKLVTSGNYTLGDPVYIGPGSTQNVKRQHSGISWTHKVGITVTGVEFTDGTVYSIPTKNQKTAKFTK